MRLNRFQKFLIIAIVFVVFRNTVFFDFELKGTYISNAVDPILEMPRLGCTLEILGNGEYLSDCMGKGTYEVDDGYIKFSNKTISWGMPILRRFNIGSPMFLLSGDHQYYMIKQ